ncbi:MAG TPA: hypothetical protein VHF92_08645 [Geodermatophilus sp.]|nr:hypothetical protein [Geodermatophilus sp.]
MTETSSTSFPGTGSGSSRAATVGTLTMTAGALFVLGPLVSIASEWAWLGLLAGLALLAYVVPQIHRLQAPADGWAGTSGSLLVATGAALVVALAVVFLLWEAVGDPGEPAWAGVLWLIGFLSFLVGIVLFGIGTALARSFPPAAPLLMLGGLVAALLVDMVTGAFFEEEPTTTEWGFFIGLPLFGLGLCWMGYALRSRFSARSSTAP